MEYLAFKYLDIIQKIQLFERYILLFYYHTILVSFWIQYYFEQEADKNDENTSWYSIRWETKRI